MQEFNWCVFGLMALVGVGGFMVLVGLSSWLWRR
jgi:hypothetical protein